MSHETPDHCGACSEGWRWPAEKYGPQYGPTPRFDLLVPCRKCNVNQSAPRPTARLTRPKDAPPMTPKLAAALTELVQLAHQQFTNPDGSTNRL